MNKQPTVVIRCVLCGKTRANHPEGCKPMWAREIEYDSSSYARPDITKVKPVHR